MDDFPSAGWLTRLIREMEHGWYPVWIYDLGFIRLKPTCDEIRSLEQRLTHNGITESEIEVVNDKTGYSQPSDTSWESDLTELTDSGLLGAGVQMRYLNSNGEGDDQQ